MPFEKYETAESVADLAAQCGCGPWWKCRVCGENIGHADVLAGGIIVKRNGVHRHERCGGPPAPDRPVKHARDIRRKGHTDGQAGAAGNEQGRVIRKGSSLS